jgi:hypothetical protein
VASRPKTLGQKAFCPEWLLVNNIYIISSEKTEFFQSYYN